MYRNFNKWGIRMKFANPLPRQTERLGQEAHQRAGGFAHFHILRQEIILADDLLA